MCIYIHILINKLFNHRATKEAQERQKQLDAAESKLDSIENKIQELKKNKDKAGLAKARDEAEQLEKEVKKLTKREVRCDS